MGFLKWAGKLCLTLFLGLAWIWSIILKTNNIINDKEQFSIVLVFTAMFCLQQAYLAVPKPTPHGVVEARKPVIEGYLTAFLKRYYEKRALLIADSEGRPPCVRVNVMLPTKRLKWLWWSYLQIYYVATPDNVIYSDDEISTVWKKGEGTCGWAWEQGRQSIYDSKDKKLSIPAARLNQSQHEATRDLNSTLSVPVWDKDKDKVVGVLNLDCEQNITESLFNNNEIVQLAAGCAQYLSAHCPSDGVGRKG